MARLTASSGLPQGAELALLDDLYQGLQHREMARYATHRGLVAETLARVIQRPDEMTAQDYERVLSAWNVNPRIEEL